MEKFIIRNKISRSKSNFLTTHERKYENFTETIFIWIFENKRVELELVAKFRWRFFNVMNLSS